MRMHVWIVVIGVVTTYRAYNYCARKVGYRQANFKPKSVVLPGTRRNPWFERPGLRRREAVAPAQQVGERLPSAETAKTTRM